MKLKRYVAELEESFLGADRRKKTNEGVVRKNLKLPVERLPEALSQ